jgi:tetratricopeptide (TPR) repeat protein
LSAENNINAAKDSFERAISLDSALGNAWLGRGLCAIRQGHAEAGRRDLQVAAALEPNRSIFHSYLGKASAASARRAGTKNWIAPKRWTRLIRRPDLFRDRKTARIAGSTKPFRDLRNQST